MFAKDNFPQTQFVSVTQPVDFDESDEECSQVEVQNQNTEYPSGREIFQFLSMCLSYEDFEQKEGTQEFKKNHKDKPNLFFLMQEMTNRIMNSSSEGKKLADKRFVRKLRNPFYFHR